MNTLFTQRFSAVLASALLTVTLAGCQSAAPAPMAQPEPAAIQAAEPAILSRDGHIRYHMEELKVPNFGGYPMVEAAPHMLTGADAQRVARALLGDVTFYELENLEAPVYTKAYLEKTLDRWQTYSQPEAFRELFGQAPSGARETIDSFLERYTQMLETAPESLDNQCRWELQNDAAYRYAPENQAGHQKDQPQTIRARASVGDVEYTFLASAQNDGKYLSNYISLTLDTLVSPLSMDTRIFEAQLCRTEVPTEAQIDQAVQKAQTMLANMALGDWTIDRAQVVSQEKNGQMEHVIQITAVPLLAGAPAIWQESQNQEDPYAHTDASFRFSADGQLVFFDMQSPIDVISVREIPGTAGEEVIMVSLRQTLAGRDLASYGLTGRTGQAGEVLLEAQVSRGQTGMLRIRQPETDSYLYLPGMTIRTQMTYAGDGLCPLTTEADIWGENFADAAVSALDGAILPLR